MPQKDCYGDNAAPVQWLHLINFVDKATSVYNISSWNQYNDNH